MSLVLGLGLMAGFGDDDPTDPTGGAGDDLTSGTITGSGSEANQAILLSMPEAVATYTILNGSDASIQMSDGTTVWYCVAGALVVSTSTDTHLLGSFTGTLEDLQNNTAIVSNGAFEKGINDQFLIKKRLRPTAGIRHPSPLCSMKTNLQHHQRPQQSHSTPPHAPVIHIPNISPPNPPPGAPPSLSCYDGKTHQYR